MPLTREEYLRRDYRSKCDGCGRWMRMRVKLGDGYVQRRETPHANRCVHCHPHHPCVNGCDQCKYMRKNVRTGRWYNLQLVRSA
jgi:phage terminase large subunit GpA-like protein